VRHVEIEAQPDAIKRVVKALGTPRGGVTPGRLADFPRRYEERTRGEGGAVWARSRRRAALIGCG